MAEARGDGGTAACPQHRCRRRGRRLGGAVGRRRARRARARTPLGVHPASVVRRDARRVAHARREHRRRVPRPRARFAAEPASARTGAGAWRSTRGAEPVVRADEDRPRRRPGAGRGRRSRRCRSACRCSLASGITGDGIDAIRAYAVGNRTLTFLGASGVGKSTIVNALVGRQRQATSAVREGDQRGRHTTVAAELVPLPGEGWLIDTPGVRALSLWLSGNGIERAFADVFDLMDGCRFRDCKHDQEPGCAVQAAIAAGTLDPRPAAEPRTAHRGGGRPRGGTARPRQGRRQARRWPHAPARAVRVRRPVTIVPSGRQVR